MPIIHKDFIFTHIQKTGGQSLREMFKKYYGGKEFRMTEPHHYPLRLIAPENRENKFKFTIIRNPFVRQYSMYNHFLRAENKASPYPSFEQYFYRRLDDATAYQEYFFQDIKLFDKVYQTERFDDMIEDIEKRLDIKFEQTLTIGKECEFDRDYRQYYSPKMVEILKMNEPTIFANFDYSF